MKRNFLTTFIFISVTVFFVSCKKDSTALATQNEEFATQKMSKPAAPTRVKTETSNSVTKTYTYNADLNSFGYSGPIYKNYAYPDGSHIIEGGNTILETHYDVNKKRLIEKGTNTNGQTFYFYNTKNQLTETFMQSGGDVDVLTYIYNKDGNLDTLKMGPSADIIASYQTFTYYTDRLNVLNNETFGEGFRGVQSKNLVKSILFHSLYNTSVTNKTYSFDTMGRVTKVSSTYDGTPLPDVSYTYY
jgi:hypothetical protein